MSIKNIGVSLLLIGLLVVTGSNQKGANTIYWSDDRKLTWDDFQGNPDYNYADVSALTSSGIIHLKGCEDGKIIYKIKAYFEKQHSWFKPEAKTNHHLAHEQIHFDITELYARKLEQALAKHDFNCEQQEEFQAVVNEYLGKWQSAQINYDLFTHYSMKRKRQQTWKHRVAMELSLVERNK